MAPIGKTAKRFQFDDNDKYLVATFLDPRFQTSFLGLVQTERATQKSFRASEN